VHNGRYVKKNLTAQTISGAISWRLVRDLQKRGPREKQVTPSPPPLFRKNRLRSGGAS